MEELASSNSFAASVGVDNFNEQFRPGQTRNPVGNNLDSGGILEVSFFEISTI